MAAARSRDKISLCARAGAPGGQRIPSFRSHISRIPLSYFTPPPPPPSPFGPFGLSLIFCSLTFRPPRSRSPSISLDCSSLWRERGRTGLPVSWRFALDEYRALPSLSRLLFVPAYLLCPRRGIHYANIIFTRWKGGFFGEHAGRRPYQGVERKFLIFSFLAHFNRDEARWIFDNCSSYLD